MKEAELHHLWRSKKIGPLNLLSTDNQSISIIHYGFYNESLAGPDFSMGIISIDGIEEVGPIEMHVKSSDWYLHRHQFDAKYNNVILHVVVNEDKPVVQNGRKIPTIEVQSMISSLSRNKTSDSNFKKNLPCKAYIREVPADVIEQVKRTALKLKYDQKLSQIGASSYRREVLYKLIACAFGAPINQYQFLQLTERVSVSSMLSLDKDQIKTRILEATGLFNCENDNDIDWNFKGVRPPNFPTIRVPQFAELTARLIFDKIFLKALELLDLKTIKLKINAENEKLKSGMISNGMVDQLIINAFLPYYYYMNEDKAIDLIEEILREMKPEQNTISFYWSNIGISVSNAFDSQSLNALSKNNCQFKKCLSCGIGQHVFKSFN